YRGIDPGDYRLLLLEAGQEILRGVHPTLAEKARESLWHEGIEIRTGARVTRVTAGAVEIEGSETIPVGLTVWAAGVKGHPTLAGLATERDRLGRVIVNAHMRLPGHPEVYGVGDAITIEGRPEASIPIIPAALAHARLAAENIVAELAGRPPRTIDVAPQGMLVPLGVEHAVVGVMGVRVSGRPASRRSGSIPRTSPTARATTRRSCASWRRAAWGSSARPGGCASCQPCTSGPSADAP